MKTTDFTDVSCGHVWAPGQESSPDNQGAREGAFRVGCCQNLGNLTEGRFGLRRRGLLLLSLFLFLMTMSHYFHGWSCCIAGSQRVKTESSMCTFKTTCDKVHRLKSGSLLPPPLPSFQQSFIIKGFYDTNLIISHTHWHCSNWSCKPIKFKPFVFMKATRF